MAPPPPGDSRRFSLFGFGDLWGKNEDSNSDDRSRRKGGRKVATPIVKLQTDKEVYRPGDSILITIELQNPSRNENHDSSAGVASVDGSNSDASGLLVERISFELKGTEKLDSQWFTTQKPVPGSKQRRGEYAFLDCSASSMIVSQIVSSGTTKTYMVQTILPNVLPPSYKGATVRYLYYVRVALYGEWLILENGPPVKDLARDRTTVESRLPLQIWVSQIGNGLLGEEVQSDGIVPSQTMQPDLYWKEMEGDSDWIRANDAYDGIEDDGDSSRDEISSVSSYNPARESIHKAFRSSLSLQSSSSRFPSREAFHAEADEVLHNSTGDVLSPSKRLAAFQANKEINQLKSFSGATDDVEVTTPLRAMEAIPSEGFVRGRSYNIRVDDQVLLRFSPKKADPNYYFSDMIGGTLTFFHEDGTRRCLEVSVTLEISETINRRFVHPSRRNSPTITKVHSDYHEVVADLVQTSFLFSVPMDGPMSFSTPRVSVQWALRFEFLTTPRNVDWRSYDHPLLVEGRDKCEWVLPITVHASQPVASVASAQNRRAPSFEPFWIHD